MTTSFNVNITKILFKGGWGWQLNNKKKPICCITIYEHIGHIDTFCYGGENLLELGYKNNIL